MGTFTKRVTLHGTNGSAPPSLTVDALVETGALFSSAPSDVLEALGVQPLPTMPVRFADGRVARGADRRGRGGDRGPAHADPVLLRRERRTAASRRARAGGVLA